MDFVTSDATWLFLSVFSPWKNYFRILFILSFLRLERMREKIANWFFFSSKLFYKFYLQSVLTLKIIMWISPTKTVSKNNIFLHHYIISLIGSKTDVNYKYFESSSKSLKLMMKMQKLVSCCLFVIIFLRREILSHNERVWMWIEIWGISKICRFWSFFGWVGRRVVYYLLFVCHHIINILNICRHFI